MDLDDHAMHLALRLIRMLRNLPEDDMAHLSDSSDVRSFLKAAEREERRKGTENGRSPSRSQTTP